MNIEARIISYLKRRVLDHKIKTLPGAFGIDSRTITDDDCVVIDWPGEFDLLVGSDFVRGTGFRLFQQGKLTLNDIGYFLVAANASDLAAMGAIPIGFLDVLRYTKDMEFDQARHILDGMLEACDAFHLPLIGGDSGGYELSVLSGTALGKCKKGSALLRRNGRPGENVYLSGPTGIAGAANAYFGSDCDGQLSRSDEEALLLPWKRSKPQLELGMFLVEKGFSRCDMDTSDGLKASIEQLSEASDLTMVIRLEDIPISQLISKVAAVKGFDSRPDLYHYVFSDSVDFHLLFSVPDDKSAAFEAQAQARGFGAFRIGYFTPDHKPEESHAIGEDGAAVALPGIGWDQSEIPTHVRLEKRINERRRGNAS